MTGQRSVVLDGISYEMVIPQPGAAVKGHFNAAEYCYNVTSGSGLPENPDPARMSAIAMWFKPFCGSIIPMPFTTL